MSIATSVSRAVRRERLPFRADTWLIAVLAYVPLLLTRHGLLADDTKVYLYFNPSKLLSSAASMWNPDVGFGTVTHQNIGYLFPMGPYYWAAKSLTIPIWVAQRFWMGSLLFLAALGVRKCAQEMGLSRWAGWVAAVPYMLSPFILVNLDRTSAILMPWAGLGWMMLFVIRAARRNDWRYPALFALVVALTGGVNATSILLVGIAPAIYLIHGALTKEFTWRRAFAVSVRISALSLLVSLWWLAGLWAEGKYGLDILRFTESFATVTSTSSASEVFRGLGYWYFYGRDGLQPWTVPALSYMKGQIVPAASYVAPLVGFVAALVIKWRYRAWAVATALVGVIIAVGSYPLNSPTPIGQLYKWLAEHTRLALALRSTNRVLPVVILALALLAAAAFDAARTLRPRLSWVSAVVFVALVCAAMSPLFERTAIASNLTLPEKLPSYVTHTASVLNRSSSTSSVLGLPGLDFAYYRYGTFNDPIWPAIMNRPWISSQIQLQGQPASINLIRALDGPLQNGIADASSIAPIARLFGASSVLLQLNDQYERFGTPTPAYLAQLFRPTPSGLHLVGTYGPRTTINAVDGPFIDEQLFGLPPHFQWPRSLAIYAVNGARTLVRVESPQSPMVVAGDGEGLVSMAQLGLLDHARAIFFDGSLSARRVHQLATTPGAWLVITDSNQRRQDTFGTLRATQGYVQQLNEVPLVVNPQEEPLPTFPHEPAAAQTTALMSALKSIGASSYGNVITNDPENQPFEAVDGLLNTAWQVSSFSPAIGQYLQMTATRRVAITQLHFVQPQTNTQNRRITSVGISIDGGPQIVRTLTEASVGPGGQNVSIPVTRGRTIRITILDDSDHDHNLAQASGVGFAEVNVAGFGPATRGLLLPTTLMARAGSAAKVDQISIVLERLRAATVPPRLDPELSMLRYVDLPYSRVITLSGFANVNPAVSTAGLTSLLGRHPGAGLSLLSASSSSALGAMTATAWDAFDGDPSTAWQSGFRRGAGEWVSETLTHSTTVSHFDLSIVNDGFHQIPTQMTISNGRTTEKFTVPATLAPVGTPLNSTQTFHITVPPISGSTFTYQITAFRAVSVTDRVSGGPTNPSFGIATISLPGVSAPVTPANLRGTCRSDLVSIDGHPISVRVVGSTADAMAQRRLAIEPCGAPLTLPSGRHAISTAIGYLSGFNVNELVLHSKAVQPTPFVTVQSRSAHWYGRTVVRSSVNAADAGQWVVFGQSFAPGWHARLGGVDLGPPTLIDGASMGWKLPRTLARDTPLAFIWEPQRIITDATLLSIAGLVLVLLISLFDWPRGRRRDEGRTGRDPELAPTWSVGPWQIRTRRATTYALAVAVSLAVSWYAVVPAIGAVWLWQRRGTTGSVLAGLSAVLIASGAGITVVATQLHFRTDISWPAHIDFANGVVWCALALWVLVVLATTERSAAPIPMTPTGPSARYPTAPPPISRSVDSEVLTTALYEDATPSGSRRRGLNVPEVREIVPEEEPREMEVLPASGWRRSLFLARGLWTNRHDPDEWHAILTKDTINQVIGKTPIFNRRVLDISDTTASYRHELGERGAHVTSMRRQVPASRKAHTPLVPGPIEPDEIEFTQSHIPAGTGEFDLVFATNVLSSVGEPETLLGELVRVTRPGGTIYFQNVMWHALYGGRETSPWHLISGHYARRRYTKKHGHEPFHRYGVNYFKLRPGDMIKMIEDRRELSIFVRGPRFLPTRWSWMLRVPVLRSVMAQDLIVAAERH